MRIPRSKSIFGSQPSDRMRELSISFCGVPSGFVWSHDLALVTDGPLHQFGQLADGEVAAAADVHHAIGQIDISAAVQQEEDRLRQVVHVQELTPRGAGPPQGHRCLRRLGVPGLVGEPQLGLVEPADECGEHVCVFRP